MLKLAARAFQNAPEPCFGEEFPTCVLGFGNAIGIKRQSIAGCAAPRSAEYLDRSVVPAALAWSSRIADTDR
jgi:hypothetical protein